MDYATLDDQRLKIKGSEKVNKYLDLAWGLKKTVKHEGDGDDSCNQWTWNNLQNLGKNVLNLKSEVESRPYRSWLFFFFFFLIDQNTEKRPGELRIIAVTQTSAKDHPLTLVRKPR